MLLETYPTKKEPFQVLTLRLNKFYREEQREKEKFNTNLSKELDQNEVSIITNNLKKKSKAKSKDSSSSSGHSSTVSGSTRSTFSEFDNTYLNFFGVKKPKKRR